MMVWAFNTPSENESAEIVKCLYESVRSGKSRFGWSSDDKNNLKLENNWTDEHGRQLFLLEIKEGDWIAHINMPEWGRCVAVQVVKDYDFDDGFPTGYSKTGKDFRHFFEIDKKSIIEFDRNDELIHPSINLNPRYRYHRVYAIKEFQKAMEGIKSGIKISENREQFHLWNETDEFLRKIAHIIHETHRKNKLEYYLAEVFKRIPSVDNVTEYGRRWGTDYGADLIVTTKVKVGKSISFGYKIVVQVKSFESEIENTHAVAQIETAIKEFDADAGMIFATGNRTKTLETAVSQASDKLGRPIELLTDKKVAEFVLRNAPDLIFPFNRK